MAQVAGGLDGEEPEPAQSLGVCAESHPYPSMLSPLSPHSRTSHIARYHVKAIDGARE